jgi:putative glutamine amidotransferase
MPNVLNDVKGFLTDTQPDALILTGGNDIGVNIERDITETNAIKWFKRNKRPILGICRGMELTNVFYGGTIDKVPPNHNNQRHIATLIRPDFIKWAGQKEIITNSYHNQGVTRNTLAKELEPAAMCGDIVEAIVYKKDLVVGLQWHPEREQLISKLDKRIFQSLKANYSDLEGYGL